MAVVYIDAFARNSKSIAAKSGSRSHQRLEPVIALKKKQTGDPDLPTSWE
jgi:hypothetical protein